MIMLGHKEYNKNMQLQKGKSNNLIIIKISYINFAYNNYYKPVTKAQFGVHTKR